MGFKLDEYVCPNLFCKHPYGILITQWTDEATQNILYYSARCPKCKEIASACTLDDVVAKWNRLNESTHG